MLAGCGSGSGSSSGSAVSVGCGTGTGTGTGLGCGCGATVCVIGAVVPIGAVFERMMVGVVSVTTSMEVCDGGGMADCDVTATVPGAVDDVLEATCCVAVARRK